MVGTGVVRGKVIGGDEKLRVGQLHVHLAPAGGERVGKWSGSMRCRPDGTFEFRGVPPGKYLLSTQPLVGAEGDVPGAVPVTVKPGQTVKVDLRY